MAYLFPCERPSLCETVDSRVVLPRHASYQGKDFKSYSQNRYSSCCFTFKQRDHLKLVFLVICNDYNFEKKQNSHAYKYNVLLYLFLA